MLNHTPFHGLALAVLGSLSVFGAVSAHAQSSGFYYGLSTGPSQAKVDEKRITANLLADGATSTTMTLDERSAAYKFFGGYRLNQHLAVEGGYFNLGKFGFQATTVPAGTLDGQIKLSGLNLDMVGTWPVSQRWSAIGRVGGQYANARDTFGGTGAVNVADPSPSKSALNYKLGLGAQYVARDWLTLRGEVERYRINDAVGNRGDVNMLWVSLVVPFGGMPAPKLKVPVAAEPAPIPAPAPAPAPVAQAAPPPPPPPEPVVQVPAAPVTQRVRLSADSLFNFDKATLRPDGKAALDGLIAQLKNLKFDDISVEGHTDRLGSSAYNQILSLRRAEAVTAYLINVGKIDGARIGTTAHAASAPVTKPADCVGNKPTVKLIACLQPDRRVDVMVTGIQ
jgi:OmpA-OmpF porin, OOP family